MRFLLLVPLIGCTPSDGVDDFATGEFQFTTHDVDDGCLDGGMEVLFMPEGTPADFADPIELPGIGEALPQTYTVSLQEPFNDMEITVDGTETTRTVRGAVNNDVEFDADQYPGCLVDNSIDVDLTIDGADEVSGTATLHTSSFDEGNCPVVDDDPCEILLTLTGERVE